MNSEELELSLRTEFENYLKGVLTGLRQDVSEFQQRFESEFEKHKAQMDQAIKDLSTRFESENTFDKAFTESVVEHLRLARDEGAQITANAFGEAEKLKEESAPQANYDVLRDAINDITGKTSQSAILKALVDHAGQFTPRGAFFIVKNEHFVGWKVFGREAVADDALVRDIHFPMSANTILAESINSLGTREGKFGSYDDDTAFLERLDFGRPDRMYAIPLTARGRGVAVLYADYGTEGVKLNVEALETLVRVAGLAVELLAASQPAKHAGETAAHAVQPSVSPVHAEPETGRAEGSGMESSEAVPEAEEIHEYSGAVAVEGAEPEPSYDAEVVEPERSYNSEADADAAYSEQAGEEHEDSQDREAAYFEPVAEEEVEPVEAEVVQQAAEAEEYAAEFEFTSAQPVEQVQSEPLPEVVYNGAEVPSANGHSFEPVVEAAVQMPIAQPVRSRLSDRNVDLPIEVADDERRLHNDARRFARLLVSEIKLYNEQKVNEGRDAHDLYDRLREAIDRSREMYDKRVQPPVAAKFDYFHYELVGSLAEGDASKLGGSYPGASV